MADEQTTLLDIPEDCLKLILSHIDNVLHQHETHRESLSLTCKQLHAITNRLPFSLSVTSALISLSLLPRLLRRFSFVESLDFVSFSGDLDAALSQIAAASPAADLRSLRYLFLNSQKTVPLRGLRELGSKPNGLKVLKISNVSSLNDQNLAEIGSVLPSIEEIDVSFDDVGPLTDAGIEGLAKTLKNLKKINFSGNPFITDKSLIVLSDCCLDLNEIEILGCNLISQHGVGYLMRHSSKLDWISMNILLSIFSSMSCSSFTLGNSISFSRNLSTLEFYDMDFDDKLLCSIAKANLPLKKFTAFYCEKITLKGITTLLQSYQDIEQLNLEGASFLTDEAVESLACYLRKLIAINVSLCDDLTYVALHTLIKNCPDLEEIKMEGANLGEETKIEKTNDGGGSGECLTIGLNLKCLKMASNKRLTDNILKKIGLLCPNLLDLDLSFCRKVTSEGIKEIMNTCCKIKHLEVTRWREPELFGTYLEGALLNLELIQLVGGKFNDTCLSLIGKACPNLLYANLTSCEYITSKGVKELVKSCTKLQEIVLCNCSDVNSDILAWMVSTRPSMRKIVAPGCFKPTLSEQELFLAHGCFVQFI